MAPAPTFRLDQLLKSPPGDGIKVSRVGDSINIDLRGGVSKIAGVLIGAYAIAVVIAVGNFRELEGLVEEHFGHAEWFTFGFPIVTLFTSIALIGPIAEKRRLVEHLKSRVEIYPQGMRLSGAGITNQFVWSEIDSLRILEMENPAIQMHARLDNPHVQGHGDGIAITSHGTVHKVLDYWHQDVNEWLGEVLSEYSGIKLSGDVAVDRLLAETPRKPHRAVIPSRGTYRLRGIGLIAASLFFSWFAWHIYDLSSRQQRWPVTEGVVVDLTSADDVIEGGERLTFVYEVAGIKYVDRFVQTEKSVQRFAIGDSVEARYDPASPGETVVWLSDPNEHWPYLGIPIAILTAMGIGFIVMSYRIDDSPNEFHSAQLSSNKTQS